MIDVDFFKLYNDSYGHQGGDDCLIQIAAVLQKTVHRPADLVARYGGEEFAVILPETDAEGAMVIAHAICQTVQNLAIPHQTSTVSQYVSVSIGVASVIPSVELSSDYLIDQADKALYAAKKQGRNCYCIQDDSRRTIK